MRQRYTATLNGHEVRYDLDRSVESERRLIDCFDQGRPCEAEVLQAFFRFVSPGDTVVDVGANAGYFTVMAGAIVGKEGRVIAIEPGSNTLDSLRNNIAINGLTNVIDVVEQPVADRARDVTFCLAKEGPSFNCIWTNPDLPTDRFASDVSVMRATTLDAVLAGRHAPKLVKIDAEGAEHLIVKGAYEMLFRHQIPFIVAELAEPNLMRCQSSQSDLRRYLYALGYDTWILYANGAFPKWLPPTVLLRGQYVWNVLYAARDDVALYWDVEHHEPQWVAR